MKLVQELRKGSGRWNRVRERTEELEEVGNRQAFGQPGSGKEVDTGSGLSARP